MLTLQKIYEKYEQLYKKRVKENYNGDNNSQGTFLGLSLVLVILLFAIALLIHIWATVLILKCGKLLHWNSWVQVLLIFLIWFGGALGNAGLVISSFLTIIIIIYGLLNCPKHESRRK
jgi:hypothetical protein